MIMNSAFDWSTNKSAIVFYAENSHVHSRREILSLKSIGLACRRNTIAYFGGGGDAENLACNPIVRGTSGSSVACIRSRNAVVFRLRYFLTCHQHYVVSVDLSCLPRARHKRSCYSFHFVRCVAYRACTVLVAAVLYNYSACYE